MTFIFALSAIGITILIALASIIGYSLGSLPAEVLSGEKMPPEWITWVIPILVLAFVIFSAVVQIMVLLGVTL